jgi:myosin-5
VQKIFPMMRDNVKKIITPMLANCIMTPKGVSRSTSARTGSGGATESHHQSEDRSMVGSERTAGRGGFWAEGGRRLLEGPRVLRDLGSSLCSRDLGSSLRVSKAAVISMRMPSFLPPDLPYLPSIPGAQLAISKSWGEILGVLESLLSTVKEANVPKTLVQVWHRV